LLNNYSYTFNKDEKISIPILYRFKQNCPNLFNPTAKTSFSIPKQGIVSLKVYAVLGNEVMTLINEQKTAENYEIDFNVVIFARWVYFHRIEAGEFSAIMRLVLIK
jgi:hypothetical protein